MELQLFTVVHEQRAGVAGVAVRMPGGNLVVHLNGRDRLFENYISAEKVLQRESMRLLSARIINFRHEILSAA